MDRRPFIIVPEANADCYMGGFCSAQNQAAMITLAIEKPLQSKGETFHVVETDALTLRQRIRVMADALGHSIEVVAVPRELAVCALPLIGAWGLTPNPTHSSEHNRDHPEQGNLERHATESQT